MMQVPSWYERDVSRETLEKLETYAALLRRWTTKINLISKASEPDLELRHIWDSAQIYRPVDGVWLDVGSGGGLPGIITSVLAQGEGRQLRTTLVESDQRKAVFLRTCARELSIPCDVIAERIEDVTSIDADIVSARALADLTTLLELLGDRLTTGGRCVFMKGETWKAEVDAAQRSWRFSYEVSPSKTNQKAVILEIEEIERV